MGRLIDFVAWAVERRIQGWSEEAVALFLEEKMLNGVRKNSLSTYLLTLKRARELKELPPLSDDFYRSFVQIKVWADWRNGKPSKKAEMTSTAMFKKTLHKAWKIEKELKIRELHCIAIPIIAYQTASRLSEVFNLTVDGINLEDGTADFRLGKTSKDSDGVIKKIFLGFFGR